MKHAPDALPRLVCQASWTVCGKLRYGIRIARGRRIIMPAMFTKTRMRETAEVGGLGPRWLPRRAAGRDGRV